MKVLKFFVIMPVVGAMLLSFQNCNGGRMDVGDEHLHPIAITKTGGTGSDVLLERVHWGWYGLSGPDYAISHKLTILRTGEVRLTDVYDRAVNPEVSTKIATLEASVIAKLGKLVAQLDVARTKELTVDGPVSCDGGSYEYSAVRADGVKYAFAGFHDCGGEWIKGNGTNAAPDVQGQVYQLRDAIKGLEALNVYVAD